MLAHFFLFSSNHVTLNKLVLHCIIRKKTHINVAMKLYGRLGSTVCLGYAPTSHIPSSATRSSAQNSVGHGKL